MNAVQQALYQRLAPADVIDASLTALGVTGVHHRLAPEGSQTPFVVFHKQAGGSSYTFPKLAWRNQLWLVKAVSKGDSSKVASQIDDALGALLNDAALAVAGWNLMVCRRETDVDFEEVVGGDTYHHVGGLYRLMVEPNA